MCKVQDKIVFITGGTTAIALARAIVTIDGELSTVFGYPLPGAVIGSLEA